MHMLQEQKTLFTPLGTDCLQKLRQTTTSFLYYFLLAGLFGGNPSSFYLYKVIVLRTWPCR